MTLALLRKRTKTPRQKNVAQQVRGSGGWTLDALRVICDEFWELARICIYCKLNIFGAKHEVFVYDCLTDRSHPRETLDVYWHRNSVPLIPKYLRMYGLCTFSFRFGITRERFNNTF